MTWTIDELVAEVATQLSAAGVDQDSARVRDVPDRRTARYYTALGLLDGPTEFRGKLGLYGERQLLQLLAIKRLQAQGEPLAAIQARLLGLATRRLRAIAMPSGEPDVAPPKPPAPARATIHGLLPAVAVHDSVTIMVKPSRTLTADDVEAIAAASAPLLRLLHARHLIGEL